MLWRGAPHAVYSCTLVVGVGFGGKEVSTTWPVHPARATSRGTGATLCPVSSSNPHGRTLWHVEATPHVAEGSGHRLISRSTSSRTAIAGEMKVWSIS